VAGGCSAGPAARSSVKGVSTITGLSVEEFRAGEWPRGAQLVEGEVVVNDPTFRHQEMVVRIL
jgi:hypothetical protein